MLLVAGDLLCGVVCSCDARFSFSFHGNIFEVKIVKTCRLLYCQPKKNSGALWSLELVVCVWFVRVAVRFLAAFVESYSVQYFIPTHTAMRCGAAHRGRG